MIMGFKVSYKGVLFFIGIMVILFAKSESEKKHVHQIDDLHSSLTGPNLPDNDMPIQTAKKNGSKPMLTAFLSSQEFGKILKESSSHQRSNLKSSKSQASAECPPLRRGSVVRDLLHILSPEIVSQANPFRYLFDKMMKTASSNIQGVREDLHRLLRYTRFPGCNTPYARALSSLLWCRDELSVANYDIREIQKLSSSGDIDHSFLRSVMASAKSPELFELFSDDILGDPSPPLRLLHKLVDMPRTSIPNLETQLKNFVEQPYKDHFYLPHNQRIYISYAENLLKFLQKKSALDELKREMPLIQHTATSDEQLLPATSVNSSATQVQDEIIANQ